MVRPCSDKQRCIHLGEGYMFGNWVLYSHGDLGGLQHQLATVPRGWLGALCFGYFDNFSRKNLNAFRSLYIYRIYIYKYMPYVLCLALEPECIYYISAGLQDVYIYLYFLIHPLLGSRLKSNVSNCRNSPSSSFSPEKVEYGRPSGQIPKIHWVLIYGTAMMPPISRTPSIFWPMPGLRKGLRFIVFRFGFKIL